MNRRSNEQLDRIDKINCSKNVIFFIVIISKGTQIYCCKLIDRELGVEINKLAKIVIC